MEHQYSLEVLSSGTKLFGKSDEVMDWNTDNNTKFLEYKE